MSNPSASGPGFAHRTRRTLVDDVSTSPASSARALAGRLLRLHSAAPYRELGDTDHQTFASLALELARAVLRPAARTRIDLDTGRPARAK